MKHFTNINKQTRFLMAHIILQHQLLSYVACCHLDANGKRVWQLLGNIFITPKSLRGCGGSHSGSSIHVDISLDTCCSKASWRSDWEAVGTSRKSRVHTDTMEDGEHNTWNRKTILSQTVAQAEWGRQKKGALPTIHTNMFWYIYTVYTHTQTHTLLAGFSVLLAVGSGWSCLPFLDGVLLILGEWNLSFSFIVKEDRWERCESKSRGQKKKKKSINYTDYFNCGWRARLLLRWCWTKSLGSLVFRIIYLFPLLEEPQPTIAALSCHFHIRICDKLDSFLFPLYVFA